MGKPHPVELRERVADFVEEGHTHRATAAHFRGSMRFVDDMVILKRETGSLAPKRQGHGDPNSKLRAREDWVRPRLEENGHLTLDEQVCELAGRGVDIHRSSVGRFVHQLGLSYKKSCRPANVGALTLSANAICGLPGASCSSRPWPVGCYWMKSPPAPSWSSVRVGCRSGTLSDEVTLWRLEALNLHRRPTHLI